MKKYIISAVCAILMVLPFNASAQTTIKGRIVDESGNPVVGAMILNKDNGKWATTDLDGKYSLEGAVRGNTLELTCLGFNAKTVTYESGNVLNLRMEEESLELDETVVIGYGSVKKKDLTGSVGIVNSKILEQQSVSQLSQSLQGAIPGLSVTRSSSMPGASASILVRGVTTIGDSSPLILVDGMAVSSIDNISSDDVDQITVLKDAAAASIYGARAAAGVILITTKSAHEGDVHISYNGEYSMIKASEWAEFLTDPINYMTMYNEYTWNDAGQVEGQDYPIYSQDYIANYWNNNAMDPIEYPNFNWKDAIIKDHANRQKHALTVSYGGKAIKTRVSASYDKTDALYEGSSHERMMARVKNTVTISKHLSADVDFSLRHATKLDPITTPIQAANMYPSIYLGLYPDGTVGPSKTGSNTLGVLKEGGDKSSRNDYITGKIAISYKPFDGFDITASVTPTYSFTKGKTFSKKVPYLDAYDKSIVLGYLSGHTTNDLTESRSDSNTLMTQVVASYENQFARKHNLNVMAGYEDYSSYTESFSTASTDLEFSNYPYMNLANMDNLQTSGNAHEYAYRSFFGRLMYNYDSRYYIQVNGRYDRSSRFHPDYRGAFFPSVSLGWVISNEKFMQNVKPVSYLKLRGSIGALGNERINSLDASGNKSAVYYAYQSTISFSDVIMYDGSGSTTSKKTAYQLKIPVPNITWETTWTYDVGLDASFFNSRLSLTGDYFYKETRNMLLNTKIPNLTGYSDPPRNAGTMHTNGWEFKIDWHDKIGDFNYGVGFNLSDATSIMGKLDGSVWDNSNVIMEGVEYNAWYGYKCAGIIRTQEQFDNLVSQPVKCQIGDLEYMDISGPDGEADGAVNAGYDRTVLGSSLPHYIFGGYVNLGWKNWSLGVLFNGVGKKLNLATDYMVRPFMSKWLSAPACLLNADGSRNYWSKYNTDEQNAKVQYPRLSASSGDYVNYVMSDYWLMNGAFLRIKNINLGYNVPKTVLSKVGVKGLRVYVNADDPFCFDHYLKGWDPEQSTNTYIARTYTIGVDIKF